MSVAAYLSPSPRRSRGEGRQALSEAEGRSCSCTRPLLRTVEGVRGGRCRERGRETRKIPLAAVLAVLLFVGGACWAREKSATPPVSGKNLFAQAGAAYEKGRFADALALYGDAEAGGMTPALAYNTGNAEFRLGRRGMAVLWFERARELAPRDEDIRFNLRVARAHLSDEGGSAWEFLDRVLTRRELPWAAVVLAWLTLVPAGLVLWGRVSWRGARKFVAPCGVLLAVVAAWLVLRERAAAEPWAVVTTPVAEARSGPGENNPVGFTVPEGRRCLVLGFRPGWTEIGVPAQGLKGWVREDSVERLDLSPAAR